MLIPIFDFFCLTSQWRVKVIGDLDAKLDKKDYEMVNKEQITEIFK